MLSLSWLDLLETKVKIDIFLNNAFPRYGRQPMEDKDIKHADLKHIKRAIKSGEHQYILRGEPTLYPYLYEVLDALQGKDFILTTSGFNCEVLFNYGGKIPYLVVNYDGFLNDSIRNNFTLTYNIMKLIGFFANKEETTTRICYTISKMNLNWLKPDAEILVKIYELYPNIKKPYFVIYQQTEIYNQEAFAWVGLGLESVKMLNHKGLMSEKNLAYMNAWLMKEDYECVSPQGEMVLAWDGKFRMCMSMRFAEEIGDIEVDSLEEIIESTKDQRAACTTCAYKKNCWLSHHFKDNIAVKKGL